MSSSSLKQYFTPVIFIVLFVFFSWSGCSPPLPKADIASRPWAFRSVLDGVPRVLTVVLDSQLSVAYHTESGGLLKAWRGELALKGAVYTGAHGPQPTSEGGAFILDMSQQVPWRLGQGDSLSIPRVQYLGHRFDQQFVTLSYALHIPSAEPVIIEETPEIISSDNLLGLKRTYKIIENPSLTPIHLRLTIEALATSQQIIQDGLWLENNRETVKEIPQADRVTGILTLNTHKPTHFTTFFASHTIHSHADTQLTRDQAMHALFEQTGCYSCHHPENKAVGPSFTAIANKYKPNEGNVSYLKGKVIKGGAGVWGEVAMMPHPHIKEADIEQMVRYILMPDGAEVHSSTNKKTKREVAHALYQLKEAIGEDTHVPNDIAPYTVYSRNQLRVMVADVLPVTSQFVAVAKTRLSLSKPQTLRMQSKRANGGVRLSIGKQVIINDANPRQGYILNQASINLPAGEYDLEFTYLAESLPDYEKATETIAELAWHDATDNKYKAWVIPVDLSADTADLNMATQAPIPTYAGPKIPGHGRPLRTVPPAFELHQARPSTFQPRVGGLDFLSDGRLAVSTWDEIGAVYILDNLDQPNPEEITVKRIASGLAEPLGLKVVEDQIYVLQKQELTLLVDHDGDEITDEYRTISNDWAVSSNFHEFAFGLLYRDGYFYANTAIGILPGGKSAPNQSPDRGRTMKINQATGEVTFLTAGLRTPNGLGFGTDGEIFVLDNQGDWLPANKIVHIRPDAFFGNRAVNPDSTLFLPEAPPVIWLPQDEIGNSPSQLVSLSHGPYAGQMAYGEVTHGGIKRAFVEKINNQYQGVVFRWMQGFEAGVNRLVWSPKDELYVGQIGVSGNWGHYGEHGLGKYGLQKLIYTGKSVFEMLAIRAKSNGLEIEFTEPLIAGEGNNPADYLVKQWGYQPTEQYGGPKIGEKELYVAAANVSRDRRRIFLEIPDMEAQNVIYLRLNRPFLSANRQELWTSEAWYTLNEVPKELKSDISPTPYIPPSHNQLTTDEQAAGWKLLFDGNSTQGWHRYGGGPPGQAWNIQGDDLVIDGPRTPYGNFIDGDDLISDEVFDDFELTLDWKISPGGNSGIFYFVHEASEIAEPYMTAPEMQILDDTRHPDRWYEKHRSGDLYDLIACQHIAVKPAGEWNQVRIIAKAGKIEHWLNGHRVVAYDMNKPEWQEMIQASKFAKWPSFGAYQRGHIGLQDHGDVVWYRNIKIRSLTSAPGPIQD